MLLALFEIVFGKYVHIEITIAFSVVSLLVVGHTSFFGSRSYELETCQSVYSIYSMQNTIAISHSVKSGIQRLDIGIVVIRISFR